jgi:hypothetical protein
VIGGRCGLSRLADSRPVTPRLCCLAFRRQRERERGKRRRGREGEREGEREREGGRERGEGRRPARRTPPARSRPRLHPACTNYRHARTLLLHAPSSPDSRTLPTTLSPQPPRTLLSMRTLLTQPAADAEPTLQPSRASTKSECTLYSHAPAVAQRLCTSLSRQMLSVTVCNGL